MATLHNISKSPEGEEPAQVAIELRIVLPLPADLASKLEAEFAGGTGDRTQLQVVLEALLAATRSIKP